MPLKYTKVSLEHLEETELDAKWKLDTIHARLMDHSMTNEE